jgi:hypothetical protein
MSRDARIPVLSLALIAVVSVSGNGCGCGSSSSSAKKPRTTPVVNGPPWMTFGHDAQHSSIGAIATQDLSRVLWSTPVDEAPQYSSGGELSIHYGSPVITSHNTVLVGVKTGPTNGFRIDARSGANGALLWSAVSDYVLPVRTWTPSYNLTLSAANRVYAPGSGGKLFYRDDPDAAAGTMQVAVFYGVALYNAAPATYDANVVINTPLVCDAAGNVYFGFTVSGATPAGLAGGIARLASDGSGRWVGAGAAAGDAAIVQMATNSAPALSGDGRTLYVAVNTVPNSTQQSGYLLALDSTTLATQGKVQMLDPATGAAAWVNDNASSSPTIGPDGDVFFGVLESNLPAHNDRGWLLHYDSTLTLIRTPGSFGWDDTASIVPTTMVPSYAGGSAYLLMSKYNNYGGVGTGDGQNRVAILDPFASQSDAISGIPVMKELLTQLGPTPDPTYWGGMKEWCINVAAVDPLTRSVLVNSEDGYLYRWDLSTNQLSQKVQLNNGVSESYTPTAIGPDGVVYAINNAALFAVGR